VWYRTTWMLITTCCWFCTLFLFDTLGDAVGFGAAYWVLVLVPVLPLLLYAASRWYDQRVVSTAAATATAAPAMGVEGLDDRSSVHSSTRNVLVEEEML
jgi:hypothetical protein